MDGVSSLLILNTTLNLLPDPVFVRFGEEMVFTSGDPIILMIHGEGFVLSADQLHVLIEPCNSDQTKICQCALLNVFPNNVSLKSLRMLQLKYVILFCHYVYRSIIILSLTP